MAANGQLCWHCKDRKANADYGLCCACIGDPGIRIKYEWLKGKQLPLPQKPTSFLPGTKGKIRIMRLRAARGERVFHPDDAREWRAEE